MAIVSCIRDIPIRKDGDLLNAGKYAEALCKFIKHADTPVTIGIQGGWGSGKTSLFTLIQSKIEKDSSGDCLFVNVNAWEHSLFQEKDSKSLVVLSILTAITEAIQEEVAANNNIDVKGKNFIKNKLSPVIKDCLHAIHKYLPSLVGVALGFVTDTNAPMTSRDEEKGQTPLPKLAEQIARLRKNLQETASNITKDGKHVKTVIFIDDLDRVSPATAVSILDVIKNIFDIEHCVFVLAIDYEVVVKGLEDKYGIRKDANEREFRQYFDKIIQVPFTMPVGAYSNEMKALLREAFDNLELYQDYDVSDDDSAIETLATVSKLATGGNPRGIKRLLNTLSLLQYIPYEEEQNLNDAQKKRYLQARFIITALHLNYPEISRRLMEINKFTSWNIKELNTPWELEYNNNKDDLLALNANHEMSSYFDEDWEKIVFCLCAKNEWLKRKAWNICKIMNMLRAILNDEDGKGVQQDDSDSNLPLSDLAMETLSHILSTISVVSIDSAESSPQERLKYDVITRNLRQIHAELAKKLPEAAPEKPTGEMYARQDDIDSTKRIYSLDCKKGPVSSITLTFDASQTELAVTFVVEYKKGLNRKNFMTAYNKWKGGLKEPWNKNGWEYFNEKKPLFKIGWTYDVDEKELADAEEVAKQIKNLYQDAMELSRQLK